ncbi:glycosyltransferase family 2 protein [Brachybacterium sp. AOP29-B2-41]|uniref:glycosyltransferase family 2 protein n=1 Tax=Brachybacterium sp. AOP29-B2-41 TaxID=3457704 RepID=UPI004033FF66
MRTPQSVVVGMATFRRPELLAALLPRLLEQIEQVQSALDAAPEIRIVVVDNDPAGSARDAATALGDQQIHYVVEPAPGISSARNRVLDEAAGADVLVFLDDDETPHAGWLLHLLATHRDYDADAVSGPVHAVFEGPEDPWVAASGAYLEPLREGTPTGTVLRRAATNNLLLDLRTARKMGLRFDPRLGLTGGEDSLLTGQLTRAGGKIVWCAEATVDDLVPAERNTRAFHLRRRRAQSATTVTVERMLEPGHGARVRNTLRWAIVGSGQIVKGAAQTGWGAARKDVRARARGERRVASGLGVLGGTLGVLSRPYARSKASGDGALRSPGRR